MSYLIAAVEDLFFASKIRATAEHLGMEVAFAKSAEVVLAAARSKKPTLIIVDLQARGWDSLALARALKADYGLHDIELVGFFSHVQASLQRAATEAGYNRVLPRSVFTKQLAEILKP